MSPPSQLFSKREGYSRPKQIVYRDELPVKLCEPIFSILRRYTNPDFLWQRIEKVFNPYGTDDWPETSGSFPISKEEEDPRVVAAKRVVLFCPWFRVYDIIEDVLGQMTFYESELMTDPTEAGQVFSFQSEINNYFVHVGIGWHFVNGELVARGDEAFEGTVSGAAAVLKEAGKPTAAGHLQFAISALSIRPKANTGGAVSHATNAVECALGEITGEAMTLGKHLDKNSALFHPALKKGLDGLYGYASDKGARHGKEGIEPTYEEAAFAVAVCSAVCTLLTKKQQK